MMLVLMGTATSSGKSVMTSRRTPQLCREEAVKASPGGSEVPSYMQMLVSTTEMMLSQ